MMAILKIKREDRTIEMNVPIYEDGDTVLKKEKSCNSYSVNNGLITQCMEIELYVGVRRINFPISYSKMCQGVFPNDLPQDLIDKVSIYEISLDHFCVKILPHTHKYTEKIQIMSTGY